LPPPEVQKAENPSKNPEKSGKRDRKNGKNGGDLYFYEFLRLLRALTIYFSVCSISIIFLSLKT
jgi:hypothetical protein